MPPRDVRRILNALFQEGIIETQEVPNKSGNMVSLFSTNFKKVRLQYYTKMIKMLLNCKKRLEFIRQKLNDKSMTWTLDEEEANRNAIYKLEYFCSDLERSIMIFSEF